MAWTDPRTWVAGAVVTALQLNQHLRDNLKTLGDPWGSYTPTYAGGITAIGSATVNAKFMQVGKWVRGSVNIRVDSTTTFAAEDLLISLPIAPKNADKSPLGYAFLEDSSVGPTARYAAVAYLQTVSTIPYFTLLTGSAGGVVKDTAPFTWANNDLINIFFEYEAA